MFIGLPVSRETFSGRVHRFRVIALLYSMAMAALPTWAANTAAEPAQGLPSKSEIRKILGITRDLSCQLRKGYPVPLFDFRIHSPYQVSIPSNDLKESEQIILRLFTEPLKDERGRPFSPPRQAARQETVSSLAGMVTGRNKFVEVNGSVATGAGEYRHVVTVDDGKGLGCVAEWKVKAKAGNLLLESLSLDPGEVADPRGMAFARQRAVAKTPDALRVAVFLNADNRSWRRTLNDNGNMVALAASLRKVAEDARVGEVAVTVFSLEDQKVLFDQDFQPTVSFRRVGSAFRQLRPGEVEFSDLATRSEARFLAGVLREREERISEADVLLFLGARSPVTDKISAADRESISPRRARSTAYLVTNPFRWRSPLERDVIGHFVKDFNGKEREIRLPEQLAKAVDGLLEEALRRRQTAGRAQ
ncbi:MAG: hypothetical protein U5J83_01855 [Bryobacterales bacterium]|nr:hypothetical protein [Bryobacterales bacterium]